MQGEERSETIFPLPAALFLFTIRPFIFCECNDGRQNVEVLR
jgi:hypothetical protein